MHLCCVVSVLLSIGLADGALFSSIPATKIWALDTNFGTPSNWEDGQLPCSNQRAVFPSILTVSVFLQTNASVREMVLPMNGEIAFDSNVQLSIGSENSANSNCPQNDAKFRSLEASHWYSPQSWRMENELPTNPVPVPEVERMPCQTDNVIFLTNTSFKAKMAGPAISINSLLIGDQLMNSTSFRTLTETSAGKLHFELLTSIDISQRVCTDVKGCLCRTNTQEVKSTVCSLTKCPTVDCTDPVKPAGSCCAMCGSVVTIQYGNDFTWANLYKLYSSILSKVEYANVQGYMSKTDNNHVQAVFTDSTSAHKSTQIALAIKDYVQSDINGLGTLGVVSISTQTSSHWLAHHLIGEGLSVGGVMGIVFGFIAVIALALAALAMYRTHCIINLPFGRLYDEFKEGPSIHFDATEAREDFPPIRPLANIEGFDNPMYQSPSGQPPSYEDTSFGPGGGTVEIRQNPVFMAFGEEDELQN